MQGVLATARQFAINIDEVLHAADLGAEDDLVFAQAVLDGQFSRAQRALHHGFHGHVAGIFRLVKLGVLVHQAGQQRLVERAPVDADAHRLVVLDGDFDHGAEVVVVLLADRHIARVDAVLGQRPRALGILLQQNVTVVMKVADDGHGNAEPVEAVHDERYSLGGLVIVDGDAHQL